MASGLFPPVESSNEVGITSTTAQYVIPDLWENEFIAAYKSNLVARNTVRVMNHRGQAGDSIRIPTPTRESVTALKSGATDNQQNNVTIIANTESTVTIPLDQWWHYGRLIKDIADVQQLSTMRAFYTDDGGYSVAKKVDSTILDTLGDFGRSSAAYDGAVIGSDGSTAWNASGAGNGASLTDAGIRRVIRTLDDADAPFSERSLIIPPIEKESLTGIARFTEQAFVGEAGMANTIRNGMFGQLYGVDVYVTTNCPTITNTGGTTSYRVCGMYHRSAIVLVEQIGIRVQFQYQLQSLGNLMVADAVWGVKNVRSGYDATANTDVTGDQAGEAIVVPAS